MTAAVLLMLALGQAPPPNVLLIVADDLNWDSVTHTSAPNLNALAARSVRITGYLDVPRCRPSLASFLSGQYSETNNVFSNNTGQGYLNPAGSLPNALLAAGYRTRIDGKYWEGGTQAMGFSESGPMPANYGDLAWGRGDQLRAQRFMREAADDGVPWFYFCSYGLPHTPHDATQDYLDVFPTSSIPIPSWFSGDVGTYRSKQQKYLANVYRMDKAAGQLVGELILQGQADNTLIVFLSDNGWAVGAMSKNAPSEAGLRTPFWMCHPSLQPGEIPAVVPAASVAPTILEFCGVPIPQEMTAPSILPVLMGGALPTEPIHSLATDGGIGTREDRAFAITARTQDGWLYRKWLKAASAGNNHEMDEPGLVPIPTVGVGAEQLYHVGTDPYCLQDVSGSNAALLVELREATAAWWAGPAPPPPPPGVASVIDDGDAGFSTAGTWTYSNPTGPAGSLQGDVHYAGGGNGSSVASWSWSGLEPGIYRIDVTWNPYSNRATDSPYRVYVDGETVPDATTRVNQKLAPASYTDSGGQKWQTVATLPTTTGSIIVRLANDANSYVIADGVSITKIGE